MAENEKEQLEQNKREQPVNFASKVASIGFFGGLIWGIVTFVTYYLNFSKVGPALALNPWALGDWKNKVTGQVIGIVVIAVISIGIAFVYKEVFVKMKSLLTGIIFGAALWGLVFYVLRPIFPDLEPLTEIGWNTIITTACIFILYGLFVGYSISFDYYENQAGSNEAGSSYSKE